MREYLALRIYAAILSAVGAVCLIIGGVLAILILTSDTYPFSIMVAIWAGAVGLPFLAAGEVLLAIRSMAITTKQSEMHLRQLNQSPSSSDNHDLIKVISEASHRADKRHAELRELITEQCQYLSDMASKV